MSGYSTVPSIKDFWSTKPTLGRQIIKNAMSRNKFTTIKKYIHLADNNNLDKEDKFAKLRLYFDLLNKNFIQFGVFSPHLSIDEQMVPYFGKHSCKMYIRNKPVRFGYKMWCLCSSTGFNYQFIPYAGAGGYEKEIGLGADIVLKLLSVVNHPENHDVYFDNFFTSYYLMCLLSERHFFATGTVRCNRLNKAKLKTGKLLPKGDIDYQFDKTNQILIMRWSDNKEVTLASNHQHIEPLQTTSRYRKQEKKKVPVKIANAVSQYNQHMGGVDLHDNAVANYRIAIRGKKWWWTLFINGLDCAIVNAWKMHCLIAEHLKSKAMSQIQFRVEICEMLLLFHDNKSKRANLQVDVQSVTEEHFIVKGETNLRCKVCHKTTIFKCKACNKHLHTKCFDKFEHE
jgi:hypothetical protein